MKVGIFSILIALLLIIACIMLFILSTTIKDEASKSAQIVSIEKLDQSSLRSAFTLINKNQIPKLDKIQKVQKDSSEILETDVNETMLKTKDDLNLKSIAPGVSATASKKKIAYAITVTRDGPFVDGALVLGYAARKVHDESKGYLSKYEADLVAFVAPTVIQARSILEANGWKVLAKSLPVALEDIQNQDYAMKMKDSGCCGADEFLKLWAFTLTEYHRVVHLDMDSIIFDSMDALYELDKEMLFTGDYNMGPKSPAVPAQGGFLVVRPSMDTFREFQAIIRKGDYGGQGWEGSRIGGFWGGQTIQGIVPFFYAVKHPGKAQELNRCEYNCMVDNPYYPNTSKCLDKQPTCQDCRLQKPELVKSAHFTICQKPWTCTQHLNPKNKVLCEIFHDKWFSLRNELELEMGVDVGYRKKGSKYKNSMGMCSGYGDKKYIPIPLDKLTNKVG